MMRIVRVLLVLMCAWAASAQLSSVVEALVKTMLAMRNTSVDPCVDFYDYACGTFIANNPIPANITTPTINLPAIDGVGEGNDRLLAKIVTDPWPYVNDLYQSCMQPVAVQEKSFMELYMGWVDEVNFTEYTTAMLWDLVVVSNLELVSGFVDVEVEVDVQQQPIIMLMPTGNTLRSCGQYSNPQSLKYLIYEITEAFLAFEDSAEAQTDANLVVKIEEFICNSSASNTAENMTAAVFSNMAGVNITSVLSALGVVATDETEILVQEPDYYSALANISQTFGARAVNRFFQWKAYQAFSMYNLSSCVGITENFPFVCEAVMASYPYPPPYDQAAVCRNFVHFMMSDFVGLIFEYEVVTSDVESGIRNMTVGIQTAFNTSLPALDWLDTYSLDDVIFKLDHVEQIIGHPNVMDKYENLTTTPTGLFHNIQQIFTIAEKWFLNFQSSPFNRMDFQFDPMIVNAFYSPNTNTINFPAGMLESPMFSGAWPKLFQYSRMGLVVGHENTHGFDNHGSKWNAYGLPGDIFDSTTRTKFNQAAQCIANYYSEFIVYNDTHINGNQTLGENIADIGGTKNSYRAYQNYVAEFGPEFQDYELISDLTVDQTFFLHMGQTWCATSNVQYLEMQMQDDVHSPARFRVLGPLSQADMFAAAFNCPANTFMNPTTRCDLW